jgi:FkbM family methyltransferase
MKIKNIAQRLLHSWGYSISRIEEEFSIRVSLRMLLSELLLEKGEVFFIQVGAYDGISGDPIHQFVKKYDLKGILLEPQKKVFQKLTESYRDCENLILINAALADQDGTRALFKISENLRHSEIAHEFQDLDINQLASFDKRVILKEVHRSSKLRDYIVEEEVESISLATLMRKYNLTSVDVLVIDTEGYDFEIIKLFHLAKVKPRIIFFEIKHLSDGDRDLCIKHLVLSGYRLNVDEADALALLEN